MKSFSQSLASNIGEENFEIESQNKPIKHLSSNFKSSEKQKEAYEKRIDILNKKIIEFKINIHKIHIYYESIINEKIIVEKYSLIKEKKDNCTDKHNLNFDIKINEIRKININKNKYPEVEIYSKYQNDQFNKINATTITNLEKVNNNENKENESYSLNDSSLNKEDNSKNLQMADIKEKKFNDSRANFYLKHKLHDIPLKLDPNSLYPPKYKINEKFFGFLYPNELITYCITESGFLHSNKKDKKDNNKESQGNYYNELGLYFCGLEIINEKYIERKLCLPNEFMCKKCMEINKMIYNIKQKYLININGRVAKKNKGNYHCFGRFLCENLIEDCINEFSCKACKILDNLSQYYNQYNKMT